MNVQAESIMATMCFVWLKESDCNPQNKEVYVCVFAFEA